MSAETQSTDMQPIDITRARRPWSRKLTPSQIRSVVAKYHSGSNAREIMKEFEIGRGTLYRYIKEYDRMPDTTNDIGYVRIECQRLRDLVVELALQNKQLRAGMQPGQSTQAS